MKKLFYNIILLFISLGLINGCGSTDSDSAVNVDQNVRLVYQDSEGNNLLNPNRPNAITEQNTDLYYLVDGQKEKVFDEDLAHPKNLEIEEGGSYGSYEYAMHVYANTIPDQPTATTFIQFKDGTMDTLKVAYEYSGKSVHLTKVWYNQELRFSPKDGKENPYRYIVITKD